MPRSIINIWKLEAKKKILKAGEEKEIITYRGIPIWTTADFSFKI